MQAHRSSILTALVAGLCLAACSAPGLPAGTGGPGQSPSPGASLTTGQLRVAIVDRFGPRWWCDPDFYPLAHDDEQALAIQRFDEMRAEADMYAAVVSQLGLTAKPTLTDPDKLAVYQLWKAARSFPFDAIGDGRYRFDYVAQPASGVAEGTETTGTITPAGNVQVEQQVPAGQPNCPICLARGTLIDTPIGPIAVDQLRLGDPVWTLDIAGRRVRGVVIALGSTPAPANHHVVRLRLADRRSVLASPGHPLADGRHVGEIRIGELVDGSRVVATDVLPYAGGETFDLVASGSTGTYFADGIPMGSTLD